MGSHLNASYTHSCCSGSSKAATGQCPPGSSGRYSTGCSRRCRPRSHCRQATVRNQPAGSSLQLPTTARTPSKTPPEPPPQPRGRWRRAASQSPPAAASAVRRTQRSPPERPSPARCTPARAPLVGGGKDTARTLPAAASTSSMGTPSPRRGTVHRKDGPPLPRQPIMRGAIGARGRYPWSVALPRTRKHRTLTRIRAFEPSASTPGRTSPAVRAAGTVRSMKRCPLPGGDVWSTGLPTDRHEGLRCGLLIVTRLPCGARHSPGAGEGAASPWRGLTCHHYP